MSLFIITIIFQEIFRGFSRDVDVAYVYFSMYLKKKTCNVFSIDTCTQCEILKNTYTSDTIARCVKNRFLLTMPFSDSLKFHNIFTLL